MLSLKLHYALLCLHLASANAKQDYHSWFQSMPYFSSDKFHPVFEI